MEDSTTSRVLRLLSLLQTRRSWPGTELAERVGVSPRTIRRDIERLRELGYRIGGERGSVGGYRLEAGADLPPLLFTDEEAVVLAIAIRESAVGGGVRGREDLTMSLLAKLEQVLPNAVRSRVRAAQSAIALPGPLSDGPLIDAEVFAVLALACRDSEIVRFRYTSADGRESDRRAEPIALVPVGRRWYFLAWDTDREDWRTYRLDRVSRVERMNLTIPPRAVPGRGAAEFVLERLAVREVPLFEAVVRIAAPFAEVEAYLGAHTHGLEVDGESTLWTIRDERLEILFGALTWLVWPFEIVEGDELREFSRGFRSRFSS